MFIEELKLTNDERDELIAYADECMEKEWRLDPEDQWFGIMPKCSDRMFDINLFDGDLYWTDADDFKGRIVAVVHLCEPTDDDNWTTGDECCFLKRWSK